MEINTMAEFINTCGFPVAITCMLLWFLNKESSQHKEELLSLREVIAQNTVVLEKIVTMLSHGKEDT